MSGENKASSMTVMFKGRLIKVGILVLFSLLMMVIYVSFFQHPPPDELLANNRKSSLSAGKIDFGASLFGSIENTIEENDNFNDDHDDDDDDDKEDTNDADNEDENDEKDTEEIDDEKEDYAKRIKSGTHYGKKQLDTKARGSESDSRSDKNKAKDDIISHKKRELGNSEEIEMADYWENFLKQQNLVPIGAVYNKCGKRTRLNSLLYKMHGDQNILSMTECHSLST